MSDQYTPRGNTRKPCPSCGSTASYYPTGKICHECARLIREGREARERYAREAAEAGVTRYHVPGSRDSFPWYGVPSGEQSTDVAVREQCQAITNEIYALVMAISTPRPPGVQMFREFHSDPSLFHPIRTRGYEGSQDRMLKPAHAEIIAQLDEAIKQAIYAVFIAGKKEGATLLEQLAAGEITVQRLNELTTTEKRS